MINSRVDIRIWVHQERVMVPILSTHQLRIPTIYFETTELTFHSGPTTARRQGNQGFLFHRAHGPQTFDEEPVTDGWFVSIEQQYGGRTFWVSKSRGGPALSLRFKV